MVLLIFLVLDRSLNADPKAFSSNESVGNPSLGLCTGGPGTGPTLLAKSLVKSARSMAADVGQGTGVTQVLYLERYGVIVLHHLVCRLSSRT